MNTNKDTYTEPETNVVRYRVNELGQTGRSRQLVPDGNYNVIKEDQ